jgi:nucleoid-associated protein YgaU
MRKDMRMGFGVGGVLLAVIIIAILVIHRNQNKSVAFDKMGAGATEVTTIDVNNAQPGQPIPPADDSANLKPADPIAPSATSKEIKTVADAKSAGVVDDSIKSDGTQWDRLFASSSDAAPKSQLRHPSAAQPATADAQPSESSPAVSDIAPKHDADNAMKASDSIPAANKPAHADSTGVREHIVKSGESFYTIARAAYGDSKHTKDLQAANPTIDASKLRPGMTLKIPALSSLKSTSDGKSTSDSKSTKTIRLSATATSSHPTPAKSDGKTYTVQSGDSLYKIARDLYGSGTKSDDIYALNRDVIGDDSTKLKIGEVLKLPTAPTSTSSQAR